MDAAVKAQAAGERFMGSVSVAKDGTVIFEKSYGSANREWDTPNAPDTKFRIGSLTKQFTAAAILLLEERGKLKVEDPITPLIPSAPESWKAVTIHQLLNHTSGIPDFSNLPEQRVRQRSPATPEQILRTFRDLPLEFEPGGKFKYSNSGYILLAFIVERVSGQSYEAFLREKLFVPLAMKDSGYDSNTTLLPKRAAGYLSSPGGLANAPYVDMHHPYGAGGLYSTTHDLLRWTTAMFGGRVLSATALQKMITPRRNDNAYGLVVGTVKGRKLIRHGGLIEGFSSHRSYDPEGKLTVVVLANVHGAAAAELSNQLGALARGERQRLEQDRLVDAVEELRPERLPQISHDAFAHGFRDRVAGHAFEQMARTDVRGHDDDRVLEIHRPAQRVRDAPVVEHLQQDIEYIRMRLLDFVKEDHGVGLPPHRLGELPALV